MFDRLRVNLEGAWLPYVWFTGTDNHLLRPDLPIPIREDGHGLGLSARGACCPTSSTTRSASASAAAIGTCRAKGYAHFEDLGGTAQPLDFKADIYGVFLQGSYHFDAI